MKKIHLKKKYIFNIRKNIFYITIFLIVVTVIFVMNFIGNKITPGVVNYAEMELEKFTTRIISTVIGNEMQNISFDNLFIVTKDESDYIKTIDYNPLVVNKMLSTITVKVDSILRSVEKGETLFEYSDKILEDYDIEKIKRGIIFETSIFAIFDNPIITNLGPKIPVRIFMLGSTNSNVNTKITSYGINNALIETSIVMNVSMQIVLPYKTSKVTFTNSVPISMKIIQGNIPNYYFNGIDKNSSSFVLPIG